MINSFVIRNFKNIENLTIPKLRRVNLIVGKNSVGKSTLLEAIAVYLSKGDESCLKDILAGRGESPFNRTNELDYAPQVKEHYLSLFRGWEENYSREFLYCSR